MLLESYLGFTFVPLWCYYGGMLYAVQAGEGGPVKIGFANSPRERIAGFQTGHHETLTVLGVCPGTSREEREVHERFFAYRLRGEWFSPAGEVLAWTRTLDELSPVPQAFRPSRKATAHRSFKLAEHLDGLLQARADELDRSVSWVIVRALERELGDSSTAEPPRSGRFTNSQVVGSTPSPPASSQASPTRREPSKPPEHVVGASPPDPDPVPATEPFWASQEMPAPPPPAIAKRHWA